MISFKQFITEARMAPLYHGTSTMFARTILNDNELDGRTLQHQPEMFKQKHKRKYTSPLSNHPGEVVGVSLSRSMKVSKRFGAVIFELDQQKLIQRYKVTPINYFQTLGAVMSDMVVPGARGKIAADVEYEEFVLGSIKPLSKYLKCVWVPGESLKKAYETSYPNLTIKVYD